MSRATAIQAEPVATVYTMEALVPGGRVVQRATFHKAVPAGTRLYTSDQAGTVEALTELVACKDIKERAEALHFAGPLSDAGEDWKSEYDKLRADYIRRQPKAWDAARAVLATAPAESLESPSKFNVRDRVQDKYSGRTATVIALTQKGFRYFLDERWELGPRHGFVDEGESFDDSHWELVTAAAIKGAP